MKRKEKNYTEKKKKDRPEKDSIAALKEKIKHQRDALNKIIKNYSK